MTAVQQPLPFTEQSAPVAETPPLTYVLLREFEKQPGCEAYTADGERIKLLSLYVWLRNLAPGLTFETFLQRFSGVADHTPENRKHPDDALRFHCPRAKAAAEELKKQQWSAKQVVDMMVLYVDVCREAERTNVEPIPLDDFLAACAEPFLTGEIPPPERGATRGPTSRKAAAGGAAAAAPAAADPATGLVPNRNPLRPTAAGQRVIYERPTENSRQIKGVVDAIKTEGDRQYVDFRADSGDLYEGCNILHFVVCAEPPPPRPEARETTKLWIGKAQYPGVKDALALTLPMGNVALSDTINQWTQAFPCGLLAEISLVNGETGPYVDAVLVDQNNQTQHVVSELPPRRVLLGDYYFESPHGRLHLEVCARQ